jgi:hypothetical protein
MDRRDDGRDAELKAVPGWMRVSALGAMLGGGLLAAAGFAFPLGLVGTESPLTHPLTAVAMVLLAFGLPALYASERSWFGTLATAAFALMAAGWIVATAAMVGLALVAADRFGATYVTVEALLAFLNAWTLAMVGALAFGALALNADGATVPRIGAWLLLLAMPLGLLLVPAFELWYVAGEIGASWLGPLSFYGLAWIVLGYAIGVRRTSRPPRERRHAVAP